MINIIGADYYMAVQGAKASVTMVLVLFSWRILKFQ